MIQLSHQKYYNQAKHWPQFDLDRQTANIFALWSANVSKHECLTGKDVLLEKDLLEKKLLQ